MLVSKLTSILLVHIQMEKLSMPSESQRTEAKAKRMREPQNDLIKSQVFKSEKNPSKFLTFLLIVIRKR